MSNEIILNDEQTYGCIKACAWYNKAAYYDEFLHKEVVFDHDKQIFTIAGFAGTGKSTLVKFIIKALHLDQDDVAFATYTGKASVVLLRKGISTASTLHKLLYFTKIIGEKEDIKDKDGNTLKDEDGNPLQNIVQKMKFVKRDYLEYDYKLIVVDEISMVPVKLMNDLLSFKVPIIALGDPFQLPPVNSEDNGVLDSPDIMLTKIHRQALDSGIIDLSMKIRIGQNLKYGFYGKNKDTVIIDDSLLTDSILKKADIILCGTNKKRKELNNQMREILGFSGEIPNVNEKIVCLKNNTNQYLINDGIFLANGIVGNVTKVSDIFSQKNGRRKLCMLDFKPDFIDKDNDEDIFTELVCDIEHFKDDTKTVPSMDKQLEAFDFGYCLTVNKFQGSEARKVVVFVEDYYFQSKELFLRWFYTAVTRSSEKLIIVVPDKKYRWLRIYR